MRVERPRSSVRFARFVRRMNFAVNGRAFRGGSDRQVAVYAQFVFVAQGAGHGYRSRGLAVPGQRLAAVHRHDGFAPRCQ